MGCTGLYEAIWAVRGYMKLYGLWGYMELYGAHKVANCTPRQLCVRLATAHRLASGPAPWSRWRDAFTNKHTHAHDTPTSIHDFYCISFSHALHEGTVEAHVAVKLFAHSASEQHLQLAVLLHEPVHAFSELARVWIEISGQLVGDSLVDLRLVRRCLRRSREQENKAPLVPL